MEYFKYLWSTIQSNGGTEVKERVQAGWSGWRRVSAVNCDRKKTKGKVHKNVMRL